MTARPIRLQLSRRKGFDLQKLSRDFNGLEAAVVTRSTLWGNPFVVNPRVEPGSSTGGSYFAVPTVEDAVACFREMLAQPEKTNLVADARKVLAGKNLACNCKMGEPCHGDVWLELVNAAPQ